MGSSSGAGKSTFARQLGELLQVPVYHLDVLFWKPGWIESSLQEFSLAQQRVVQEPAWIIEGNYSTTYPIRAGRANTIIYLDVSLTLSLWRVFSRRVRYRNKSRPDMAPGCPEKIDGDFLWFILRTYHRRRRTMADRLEGFRQSGKEVLILHGHGQQVEYLRGVAQRPPHGVHRIH